MDDFGVGESTLNDPWNYVWYNDMRNKEGRGRVWVCYGTQNWCSYCDWLIPGTVDMKEDYL